MFSKASEIKIVTPKRGVINAEHEVGHFTKESPK